MIYVSTEAFMIDTSSNHLRYHISTSSSSLHMATTGEEKAAPLISGADLEVMLADLDQPLVIDAYATWYDFYYYNDDDD